MLGDSICFLPALFELKENVPDSHITLVCFDSIKNIFDSVSFLDEIITVKNTKGFQGISKWKTMAWLYVKLKKNKYSCSISSYESFSVIALLVFLLRIPLRIGYAKYCKFDFLFTHAVPFHWQENIILRDYRAIEMFFTMNNVQGRDIPRRVPIKFSDKHKIRIDKIYLDHGLREGDKVIVIHPSSSRESRKWPLEKFQQLVQNILITIPGITIVVIGIKSEYQICNALSRHKNVVNLCGQLDLLELSCLLSQSDCFIGHSSGPFHMAQANGIPTITLWGASDSKIWGPFWNKVTNVVIDKRIICSPCETEFNSQEKCPLGTLDCMKGIEVAEVTEAVKTLLSIDNI